ncbi:hypothetical protein [Streptomyces sp. NPDC059874]
MICGETDNPPDELLQGKLTCEIGAALIRPSEFVTVRVTRDVSQN